MTLNGKQLSELRSTFKSIENMFKAIDNQSAKVISILSIHGGHETMIGRLNEVRHDLNTSASIITSIGSIVAAREAKKQEQPV